MSGPHLHCPKSRKHDICPIGHPQKQKSLSGLAEDARSCIAGNQEGRPEPSFDNEPGRPCSGYDRQMTGGGRLRPRRSSGSRTLRAPRPACTDGPRTSLSGQPALEAARTASCEPSRGCQMTVWTIRPADSVAGTVGARPGRLVSGSSGGRCTSEPAGTPWPIKSARRAPLGTVSEPVQLTGTQARSSRCASRSPTAIAD